MFTVKSKMRIDYINPLREVGVMVCMVYQNPNGGVTAIKQHSNIKKGVAQVTQYPCYYSPDIAKFLHPAPAEDFCRAYVIELADALDNFKRQ